jgi:hypothetical protein
MTWQSSVATKLPAFHRIALPKRASVLAFALFLAALLSTVPLNPQHFVSKFSPGRGQLNASLGIAIEVDNVWAADTNNNRVQMFQPEDLVYVADTADERSQVFDQDGKLTYQSGVAENNDDQWNSISVGWGQPALFRIGYFQLPAFVFLQVVDQISSYRFILY